MRRVNETKFLADFDKLLANEASEISLAIEVSKEMCKERGLSEHVSEAVCKNVTDAIAQNYTERKNFYASYIEEIADDCKIFSVAEVTGTED